MATTNEPVMRAFNSLSAIYDALDGTDVREDLLTAGYSEEEADVVQGGINNLISDLEDILPGLEMNRTVEDE